MLSWLTTNWFNVIAFIVPIYIGFEFYRRSLRDKTVQHSWEDVVVISPEEPHDEHLKIVYGGLEVPKVTRSRLAFWNSGRTTVDGSDVLPQDPLRIEAAEGERILRVLVVKRSRDITGGDLPSVNEKQAIIRFCFLDRNDGFIIEVLHTGAPGSLLLKGTIKGIPTGSTALDRDRGIRWFFGIMVVVIAPALLLIPAFVIGIPIYFFWQAWYGQWPQNIVALVAGIASPFAMWFIFRADSRLATDGPLKISGMPDDLAKEMRLSSRTIRISLPPPTE